MRQDQTTLTSLTESRQIGAPTIQTSRERFRIATIWINYGLYHLARARSLAKHAHVEAVELAGFQRIYRWRIDSDSEPFTRHTLQDRDWEDHNPFTLSLQLWKALSAIRPDVLLVAGYTGLPFLTAAVWGIAHRSVTILMSESTATDRPRSSWREFLKGHLVRFLF